MVARRWHWTSTHVFWHIGLRALLGIVLATCAYGFLFRKELAELGSASKWRPNGNCGSPCPLLISFCHIAFLAWTVGNSHNLTALLVGAAAFLLFVRLAARYQSKLRLRESVLVGIFLAGLVLHGGLQNWWIEPLLSGLGPLALFVMAAFLSSFNDNAAVTYLTTLVPSVAASGALQLAVVSGAIGGGGLTVIANAPNPAGQSLLQTYFPGGISPLKLFLAALLPTAAVSFFFLCGF
jgi:hypothetical protein